MVYWYHFTLSWTAFGWCKIYSRRSLNIVKMFLELLCHHIEFLGSAFWRVCQVCTHKGLPGVCGRCTGGCTDMLFSQHPPQNSEGYWKCKLKFSLIANTPARTQEKFDANLVNCLINIVVKISILQIHFDLLSELNYLTDTYSKWLYACCVNLQFFRL